MKRSIKIAAGIVVSLGLGFAVATAYAHPGQMGGMGPWNMGGGMGQGMMGRGMGYGPMGGGQGYGPMAGAMGNGPMAGGMGYGPRGAAGQQLMTPEEQTAFRDKMHSAATPEERQKLAEANYTEMQKRAKEKGITLPEAGGRHPGFGRHFGPNFGPGTK